MLRKALRFLYGQCCSAPPTTTTTTTDDGAGDQPLGFHGVSSSTVGVSILAHHLFHFEITSEVPEGLSEHVNSPKEVQSKWYEKLLEAWRESKPPPTTPEEASILVLRTLPRCRRPADIQGLLSFYGLPLTELVADEPPPLIKGFKFVIHTLPVDARSVGDGDGLTVYVSALDPPESSCVPHEVRMAFDERQKALGGENHENLNALEKHMKNAGYEVRAINNKEILARKYRIRLRGIDAPENAMLYGEEAKNALLKIVKGKCLRIVIYDKDQYERFVGDVFCNDRFVQEIMLKKGHAWHYTAYDKRPQFAQWEKEARDKGIGLWASENPEMPWKWRKNHPESRY